MIFSIGWFLFLLFSTFSQFDIPIHPYNSILIKGSAYRQKGEFLKAIEIFEGLIPFLNNSRYFEPYAICAKELSISYWNTGNIFRSKETIQNSIFFLSTSRSISTATDFDSFLSIIDNYNAGKQSRTDNNIDASIHFFSIAIEKARTIKAVDFEQKCLRQQSLNLLLKDDLSNFFALNNSSLNLAILTKNKREQGFCKNNIGIYYLKCGIFSSAIDYLLQALDTAKFFNDTVTSADCLNNLSICYAELGAFEKANSCLLEVFNLDKSSNNNMLIATDFNNLGIIYRREALLLDNIQGYKKALDCFFKAYRIAKANNQRDIEIRTLNNIGTVYHQMKMFEKAKTNFFAALDLCETNMNAEITRILYNNIGIVLSNLEKYKEANEYFEKAINSSLLLSDKLTLWESYLEVGNTMAQINKINEAIAYYKASIAIIEEIRSTIKTEELKASYFGSDKRYDAYFNLVDLLIQKKSEKLETESKLEIFSYLEKAKARAFLDSIELGEDPSIISADDKSSYEENNNLAEISKLYRELLVPNQSNTTILEKGNKISYLERQWEISKRLIAQRIPNVASLRYPRILDLKDVRGKINSNTAIIAFLVGKERSYGFLIGRSVFHIFSLPARKILRELVSAYISDITDRSQTDFSNGLRLYKYLIEPAGIDERIENIIIVPDDALFFLPFESLICSVRKKDWIINHYSISYAPSISSFYEIRERRVSRLKKPNKDILIIGNPISSGSAINSILALQCFDRSLETADELSKYLAYGEIEEIREQFKRSSALLTGNNASEFNVKNRDLTKYKIIHFAAHGQIDNRFPLLSSIMLGKDPTSSDDGLLQMREIYKMNIPVDLVVLSACQSGLGKLIRGEGIEGINRAFLSAGAASALMTLWSVHDQATAQLLGRFYVHLRSSDTVRDALRKAKLEMIASRFYSHPFYWAGFVVNGDIDNAIFPRISENAIFLIAAIATMLFVVMENVLAIKKKKRF